MVCSEIFPVNVPQMKRVQMKYLLYFLSFCDDLGITVGHHDEMFREAKTH